MQTNEELLATIENYLAQTDFPAEPELLYAPIGYSLGGGGKRLRPMLVMLSCGIFSDQIQSALPAAAAVEMFHNFTLLHDDIMDNAAMRRGKPSVFARWGQNVAILSGDAMLICAYRLLSGVPAHLLPQILATFNQMALEVCEGQQYDMDFEQKQKVSVVEYMHMIELKTSVLLAGSAVIGATLGGASEEDYLIVNPYAGWSIEGRFAFDVKAGALFAPQRGRSVDHEWRKPYGGQLDLTISRWGVKIENNLYVGKNLQPLRGEIANPATGITYGADGLYAGEAFYATTEHIYNRTWVGYDRRFFKDTMHVEAGMVFHYDGTGLGTQQVVKLSVDIQKLFDVGPKQRN